MYRITVNLFKIGKCNLDGIGSVLSQIGVGL